MSAIYLGIITLWIASPNTSYGATTIDQQNVDANALDGANTSFIMSQGQSFTPTLNGVDFITLKIADYDTSSPGGKIILGLGKGPTGGQPILGYSNEVTIPANLGLGFHSYTFTFPERIAVTPGEVYAFGVIPQSGQFGIAFGENKYEGGAYFALTEVAAGDMYFIEGIIVPEPGVPVLTGAAALILLNRRRQCRRSRTHL
jgi:hypothetical protein